MAKKVAVIIGSLRKESWNRKLALQVMKMAEGRLEMEIVEIGNLAHYNDDIDKNPPQEYVDFRKKMSEKDAVLFVTPEYNRSMPGVLKNAIDVGSRPPGKSIWNGKAGGIITATTGALGAFGANHAVRQCMVAMNVAMMQQPEAYLGGIHTAFNEDGSLNENTGEFMKKFVDAFVAWVEKF